MSKKHHKKYPCPQCQTNLIRNRFGICRECYIKNARERKLAKDAEKERQRQLRPKRQTRKQSEIGQAKRRRWAKAPKCSSVPKWKLKFVKVGEDTEGKEIYHEIGACDYYRDSLCGDTCEPCPFNGVRDFTEIQHSELRSSKSIDAIGLYPTRKNKPRAMSSQAGRGRPTGFNPPSERYATPTKRLLPIDGNYWDNFFREIER